MNQLGRTLAFVVVAAVSVLAAAGMHWASRPAPRVEADVLGKPFFKDFTDPTTAQGLKVVLYDEDTASIKDFEVVLKDGKWRIPSHHDYPADGKDRLARTAASVMEITKAGLASPREADHARFNVLDPLNEDGKILKGRGQRITLTGEGGAVLADYIIGKKVDKRDGYYYVRNPKEKQTYLAKVEINLTTKFADWIEADLLKLDAEKLVAVDIEKYSVDRTKGEIVNQELSKLSRKSSSDPWTLDGLNAETEELKTDEVRTLVNNLDDLKIVGVRPKPPGLRPDLTVEAKIGRNPLAMQVLKNSLIDKGFLPMAGQDGNAKLVSTEGAVIASTNEGVEYVLNFGEVFTGSDVEIESGFAKGDDESASKGKSDEKGEAKKDAPKADAGKESGAKDGDAKDDAPKDEDEEDEAGPDLGKDADKPSDKKASEKKKGELKKSRYLMVLVQFDESRLGPEPVKPEKPEPGEAPAAEKPNAEKPEGAKPDADKPDAEKKESAKPEDGKKEEPKKDETKKEGAGQDEDEEQDDAPAKKDDAAKPDASKSDAAAKDGETKDAGKKDPEKKEQEPKDGEKKESEKKDPAYEAKLAEYQRELEKYENDVKLREGKIEKGRKQVDQLNKRFGPWYYVISAESFDSLRLARSSLIKTKEPAPGEKKDDAPKDGEKKDDAKPDADKPDDKKPEEKKPEEKKPEGKAEEKKEPAKE